MPTATLEETKITAKFPARLRPLLEEAAELSGSTLSQFVVDAARERAQRIVEGEMVVKLSRAQAKRVFALIDAPPKPNKALRKAVQLHRDLLGAA